MNNGYHKKRIQCLVPDLPPPSELLPYLETMHKNRWYSNFGELSADFETGIIDLLAQTTQDNSEQIFCCSASSGTAALEIAISALNLKKDSNVLVPSLTFPATATSIFRSSLIPLISDVCTESWQLTPEMAFKLAEQYNVSAVIPVATFGVPVDSSGWDRFTRQTNIPVIIDAAGAFPFQKIPKHCSVIFSYHATKAFGIGEGGAIFVKSQLLNRRHKQLSNFGYKNGLIKEPGLNAKLSEYHASVGLAQLDRWPQMLSRRTKINSQYEALFSNQGSLISQQLNSTKFIPSLKVIKCFEPAIKVIERLDKKNIESRRWYLPPLHFHPLFESKALLACDENDLKLPVSNYLNTHLIGLPFHNFLNVTDVENIVSCTTDITKSLAL